MLELKETERGVRLKLRVKAGGRRNALLGIHAGALKLTVTAAPEKGTGGPALTLGEVVPWRGRRIVSYRLTGLQADGGGRARRWLRAGEWEIRFEAWTVTGPWPG